MAAEQDPQAITPDEVRSALSRVVASDTFARSERSRSFITYLVETEQAGDVDRLKGFAIAVDVFGRADDFDPASDAVVRVQAGRLRELLDAYYAAEGSSDPVRISVPRGSYAPSYKRPSSVAPTEPVAAPVAPDPVEERVEPTPMVPLESIGGQSPPLPINPATPINPFVVSSIRKFWLALMAVLALLILIVVLLFVEFRQSADTTNSRPQTDAELQVPALALPKVTIVDRDGSGPNGNILSVLATAIARFSEVSLRNGQRQEPDPGGVNADYDFRISQIDGDTFRLEVVHNSDGDVLWSGPVSIAEDAGRTTSMKGILTTLLPSDGLIYAHTVDGGKASQLMICMKKTQDFFRSQNTRNFNDAYNCHKRLLADGHKNTLISADLASLMIEELDDQYPVDDTFSIKGAIDEARNAVNLGPTKATAYRALARALHFAGDDTSAFDAMKRAYEINPNDLNIVAAWGYALDFVGQYDEAVKVLRIAATKTDRGLPWWHHTMFLAALAANDNDAVIEAALGLARETNSVYLGAQLIATQIAGDERKRASLLERLNQSKSAYSRNPLAYYEDHLPPEAAVRAAAALRDAGFLQADVAKSRPSSASR